MADRAPDEAWRAWIRQMNETATRLTPEELRELQEWKRQHIGEGDMETAGWPGWKKYIGAPPWYAYLTPPSKLTLKYLFLTTARFAGITGLLLLLFGIADISGVGIDAITQWPCNLKNTGGQPGFYPFPPNLSDYLYTFAFVLLNLGTVGFGGAFLWNTVEEFPTKTYQRIWIVLLMLTFLGVLSEPLLNTVQIVAGADPFFQFVRVYDC